MRVPVRFTPTANSGQMFNRYIVGEGQTIEECLSDARRQLRDDCNRDPDCYIAHIGAPQ